MKQVFMPKISAFSLFLIAACSCLSTALYADTILKSDPKQAIEKPDLIPVVYQMKFVYIFEGDKPEVIINVGNTGFRTVAALKNWAKGLPSGTTIEFLSSCRHVDNEPVVMSEKDMEEFKVFCMQHNVNFVIRPAG